MKKIWHKIIKFIFVLISAGMKIMRFKYSAHFLWISLTNEKNGEYYPSSDLSKKIKKTKAYKEEYEIIKNELKNTKENIFCRYGKIEFNRTNSTIDLYLSLHNIRYFLIAKKVNNIWKMNLEIYDIYNFSKWEYEKKLSKLFHNVIVIFNNYSLRAQKFGVIKPFSIKIMIEEYYPINN